MAQKNFRSARSEMLLVLLFSFMGLLVPSAKAIWLTLPSSGTKCVSEEIQTNVVVLADYYVIDDSIDHHQNIPTISVRVRVLPNLRLLSLSGGFMLIFQFCFTAFPLRNEIVDFGSSKGTQINQLIF